MLTYPTYRRLRTANAKLLLLVSLVAALATLLVTFVLVTMFRHKQEARQPFVRVADVTEISTDPVPWGQNWPHHFDGWKSTAGDKFYGGSRAAAAKQARYVSVAQTVVRRLCVQPRLSRSPRPRLHAVRPRGHRARHQEAASGRCLHCHASATVLYRKTGLAALGQPTDDAALAADFNMPAVIRGFQELSQKPYQEVFASLVTMPDGTAANQKPVFPTPPVGGFTGEIAGAPVDAAHAAGGEAHPVTCIDCHDPRSLAIRVTRPGFVLGMQALAAGEAPVPHIPSVERWRRGDRKTPYDPNADATRQEMRSFVCGQCHVEYYCGPKSTLTFPWANGLKMEDAERTWEETKFGEDEPFMDFVHGETGAATFKVQHPEFELWSQGVHARSGVSCADCHMPYHAWAL